MKQQQLGSVGEVIAQSAVKNNQKAITTSINIGFILVGVAIVGLGMGAFYKLYWENRFRKLKHDPNKKPSNVSPSAAKAKAQALYSAMKGMGTNLQVVKNNLTGVNYNGWVDVYNAFGKRSGSLNFSLGNSGDEDLIEFLQGDLSENELKDLRRLMGADAQNAF